LPVAAGCGIQFLLTSSTRPSRNPASHWYGLSSNVPSYTQILTSSEITITSCIHPSIHPLTANTSSMASDQGSNPIEHTLGDQENKDNDQGLQQPGLGVIDRTPQASMSTTRPQESVAASRPSVTVSSPGYPSYTERYLAERHEALIHSPANLPEGPVIDSDHDNESETTLSGLKCQSCWEYGEGN